MDAAALVSRAFRPIRVSARVGLDLLLPPTCPGCRAIVPRPGQFCGSCWAELRFISDPRCASCGLPFELAGASWHALPAVHGHAAALERRARTLHLRRPGAVTGARL